MGKKHKTLITFDLQLYEHALKLPIYSTQSLDHLVFGLVGMHTVMALLRALWSSIEDSGVDEAWLQADLFAPTTVHQILEGNHKKRAL